MFSVIKKINKLLNAKQKSRLAILGAVTIVGAFLEVIGVSLMLPLITAIMQPDIIRTNKYIAYVCNILDLHSHRTFVIVCIIAVIFVFIFKDMFLIMQYYIQTRFVCNNQFAMQQRMLSGFLNRPYEFFLNTESGEILRVIQSDVPSTYALLTTVLGMFTESVVALSISITIFIIDPIMTIFVIVMMGIVMIAISKLVKPILKKKGEELLIHNSLMYKWLLQSISGIKEIKVGNKEDFFKINFEISGKKSISAEKWRAVFSNIPRLMIEMVSVCSTLAFIAFMIYKGKEIETLVPTLGAFAMAAMKLMPSANRIIAGINQVVFQLPSLNKLLEDIELFEEDEIKYAAYRKDSNRKTVKKLTFNNKIELKDVTYSYQNSDKLILDKANMTIPIGKSIGIIGVSGAGKTTAVDIILGILLAKKGEVLVDGVNVMDHYQEWISNIGYIPQNIFMLDDDIKSNIAFGVKSDEQDDNRIWQAIREAQLEDFVKGLKDGIHTQIGERGMRLSGGQKQRIGIARALYSNPEVIIFDEATSALDSETESAVMSSINSLHGKKTMIIIAHRLQTIKECDVVYRVANGKIEITRESID
ncbi:MAG: ABC transporter ATP-binding protein [Catonella sp.]|uniref:ABC transporter ATP-binding protein n=1 Tax=Catonella sp. TaxID=2382125 RepID=UPI003FA15672